MQQGVEKHGDTDDHDHAKGERVAQARVADHDVARQHRADEDRYQRDAAARQGVGRGVRAEGVAEEQDKRTREAGQEHRQAHVPPILPLCRPEVLGGLAPLFAQPFERWGDDEDHERKLEVDVDERQAEQAVDRKTVRVDVEAQIGEQHGDDTGRAECGDKGEGQWDAGEVRGHAGERGEQRLDPARTAAVHGGVSDEQAEQRADHGAHDAHLDAGDEGLAVLPREQGPHLAHREGAARRLEGLDDESDDRHGHEERRVSEEGHDTEPREAPAPALTGPARAPHTFARRQRSGGLECRQGVVLLLCDDVVGHALVTCRSHWLRTASPPSTRSAGDLRAPLLGEDLGRGRELVLRGELDTGVLAGRRQRGGQRRGNDVALGKVGVPRRVREAGQVEQLAHVGVDVFLPEARRLRVGSGGADRLAVEAAVDAGLGDRHGIGRVAGEALLVGQVQVVPDDGDRRGALGDVGRQGVGRDVVAGLLELGEEVDARLDVVERAAVGERRGHDGREGVVGRARVAVDRDLALVARVEKIGPVLRRSLLHVSVGAERDHAVVVAVPVAGRVFHAVGDRGPGLHEVRRVEAAGLAGSGERRTDVDHVGRARLTLEGRDRLVLLGRRAVGVGVVDGDPVLRLEPADDRPVVGPVGRQGDGVDLALGLGRRFEVGDATGRKRGRGRYRRRRRAAARARRAAGGQQGRNGADARKTHGAYRAALHELPSGDAWFLEAWKLLLTHTFPPAPMCANTAGRRTARESSRPRVWMV